MSAYMPMSNESASEVASIIGNNLRKLIKENGITQRHLAEQLGVAPATMTDYCTGKRVPQATFLVELRKLYGIDLNAFMTSDISSRVSSRTVSQDSASEMYRTTCRKYCGLYYTYYLDTSRFKGRDTLTPAMSLLFGVLYIYEDPSLFAGYRYNCAAVLGLSRQKEAECLIREFKKTDSPSDILTKIENEYAKKAYYGSFELSQEHAFLSMRHAGTDRALAILHRVDNNKPDYAGGIATINSVSKGRERMPVVQFFGLSRHLLSMSPEEIQHALLLNYPTINVEEETGEILRVLRMLYVENEDARVAFSPEQKRDVIRSTLERLVRKNLERNAFRYAKISGEDDDEWYHRIKLSMDNTTAG
ncbi:MAG: helix-turn-helix transcriptional regulator [Eubacteriales bacterium]|nr:helix-turn-helix transcriptional regulator [Eubacteriales bacterium]